MIILSDDPLRTIKNRLGGVREEVLALKGNYEAVATAVLELKRTNTDLLMGITKNAAQSTKILEAMAERTMKAAQVKIETDKKQEQIVKAINKTQVQMRNDFIKENKKLKKSIEAVTTAMQNQAQAQNPQDAEEMIRKEKERVEAFKKLQEEYGKFVKKEIEANENLDTRSRILGVAIAKYKKETGDRKLPFFEGMSLYLEEGGTRAEYLAQFLTSTREELKVFGVEVASVRKFMYGFLPPGTFRLVNKFASTLNFIGGTMRTLKADAEGTGNILTTTLFSGTIDKKGLRRLKEKI